MAAFKPTLREPTDQGKNFEKKFTKTMNQYGVKLNETDSLLSEVEQSLKKKIFSLAKMEALVFSDPMLKAKYEEMAENGEEKYGYHYNETIQNMLFNDYVLNSPKYLQKYKMAIPKEKKRRDKSGINQLKKSGEQTMQHRKDIQKPKPQPVAQQKPAMGEGDEQLTKVQFLVNEKDPNNPDLFAYFPEEGHNAIHKTGYSHVGQHSAVHPEYAAESRPATPEEYADLKAELEGQGYNLEVIEPMQEMTGSGSSGAFAPALGMQRRELEEETTTGSVGGDGAPSGAYYTNSAWGGGQLMKGKSGKQMHKPQIKGGTIIQESNYLIESNGFEQYIDDLDNDDILTLELEPETDMQTSADNQIELPKREDSPVNPKVPVGVWDKIEIQKSKATPIVNYIEDKSNDSYGNLENMGNADLNIIKRDLQNKKLDNPNLETMEESKNINEKAKSPEQQRLFGMAHAVQKGELSPSKVGGAVKKIAKDVDPKDVEDFASTKHSEMEENVNETDQSMIDDNQQSMSNKPAPIGGQGGGNVPTGTQQTGGAMNEDFKLLEELNNELNAYSIHHNKLMKMAEDKKTSSLIMKDRLGDENKANFKKDLQHSGTKEIIDVEKELQWKDQQTDVPNDPMKLAQDIEDTELKVTDGEALKNVGDSANDKGDEIPKRNFTTKEQEEVDLYRKGMQSWVYDNEPSKRFTDRMKADMGDKMMDMREKQLTDLGKQPMYNKDTQPTETGIEKKQFDKEKSGFNDPEGLKESLITGRYSDALNKRRLVDFTLNEALMMDKIDESLFELDFTGLGNAYNSKTTNKKVTINETVANALDTHKFYTDGKKVFAMKNPVQKLNENEQKAEKPVVNEQMEKMKHLLGYKPSDFVNTKNIKL